MKQKYGLFVDAFSVRWFPSCFHQQICPCPNIRIFGQPKHCSCPTPKQSSFWSRKRCRLQVVSRNHDQTQKKTTEFILLQHARWTRYVCVPWFFPTLQGHQGGSQRTKGVKGFSTRPLTTTFLSLPPAQPNKRPKGVVYSLWKTLFQKPKNKALDPNLFFGGVSPWNMALTLSSTFCDKRIFWCLDQGRIEQKISDLLQTQPPTLFPHTCGQRCR